MRSLRESRSRLQSRSTPGPSDSQQTSAGTTIERVVIRSGVVAWSLDPNHPDDPTARRVIAFFGFAERELTEEHYAYAREKLTEDPTRYIAMHFTLTQASREMMEYYAGDLDDTSEVVLGPVEH